MTVAGSQSNEAGARGVLREPPQMTARSSGDPEQPSAANLNAGNVLKEDGVDHRVEPQTWRAERDAQGNSLEPETGSAAPVADSTTPDIPAVVGPPPGPAGPASGLRDETLGYGPDTASASEPADDPRASWSGYGPAGPDAAAAATTQFARPYVAQPQGPMARITAPFSALTRNKGKSARRPAHQQPAYQQPAYQQPAYQQPAYQQNGGPQRPPAKPGGAPGPVATRRAQLVLSRIEPWSVMKFSFLISLVGWVVLFVAVAALYFMLAKLGVFHTIESTVSQVTSSRNHAGSNASSWFSASRVLGYTMLVGAINVVVITALATVGSVIYNLVTHLAGGIEVTLRETD